MDISILVKTKCDEKNLYAINMRITHGCDFRTESIL